MKLFPAIDLIGGEAVRLLQGDYDKKTVYSADPVSVALGFKEAGAEYIHVVDLDGAKSGGTPNFETVKSIIRESGLNVEIGGGIRSREVIDRYIEAGAYRVILGTVSVTDPGFTESMVREYGEKIAVGVDIKDGLVAIKGWTEVSEKSCFGFCQELQNMGVKTVICTDISKDGLLSGTNIQLYGELISKFKMDFTASGGLSSIEDVIKLRDMGMYGAILGKALYTKNIDLKEAVSICKGGAR
jgi:phosphoribosylformimino-5-aminoimidazole carboxamide ribotide isomerase